MAQQLSQQQLMDKIWSGLAAQSTQDSGRNDVATPRHVLAQLGGAALAAEIRRLFPDGLPPLEETAAPQCDVCGDCGLVYVNPDAKPGDADFSKFKACPNPNCERAKRDHADWLGRMQKKALDDSDFADGYREFTFASFSDLIERKFRNDWRGKKGGYAVAAMFAVNGGQEFTKTQAAQSVEFDCFPHDDGTPQRNVVLYGEPGYGKTALAAAAFNLLIANGRRALFMRASEVVARIQATYGKDGKKGENTDFVLEMYKKVPFLILDEFAFQSYTPDRLEKIEEIVRGRDRFKLPTLYTTNTRLEEIEKLWDVRIADIVRKAHWVPVTGVKLRVVTNKPAEIW